MCFLALSFSFHALNAGAEEAPFYSRSATVSVREAAILQDKQPNSPVLERVPQGTKIYVGIEYETGFYKVLTRDRRLGWISANSLLFNARPEKTIYQPAPAQPSYSNSLRFTRKWSASVAAGVSSLSYGELLDRMMVSSGDLNLNWNISAEVQYQASARLAFAFRVTQIKSKGQTSILSGSSIGVQTRSLPIEVGMTTSLFQKSNYSLHAGVYAGMAFNQTTASQNLSIVSYSTINPCVSIALANAIQMSPVWSLWVEPGYRLQSTAQTDVSQTFGSGFKINYSGIYLNIGATLLL